MIKLTKSEKPEVLEKNAKSWTDEVMEKLACGEEVKKHQKNRYNHKEIKDALLKEVHGKCAYCESKLRHITYGDIEHILPKTNDAQRLFEWSNLTIACDICNTNKSDFEGDVVDPYAEDPETIFAHAGPVMFPKPGVERASLTERLLKLNRPELLEMRRERLSQVWQLFDNVAKTECGDLKKILLKDIEKEAEADKEYAAVVRTVLKSGQFEYG